MTEKEFIESIDLCFPYKDKANALKLIQDARRISFNATCMVLHEILCPSGTISLDTQIWLYKNWLKGLDHKLLPFVCEAAETHLEEKTISFYRVIYLMSRIKKYKGEYNALNIVSLSYDGFYSKLVDIYFNYIIVTCWNHSIK